MLILGIDPGAYGAMALYDTEARRIVFSSDMPTSEIKVGKTKRKRLVIPHLIANLAFVRSEFEAKVAVIEEVGGITGQSASAAFAFGYSVGVTHAAALAVGFAVETVQPGKWKKELKVPVDKKDAVAKACELLPDDKQRFYNKRGTPQDGVAEAAMIAYWFGTRVGSAA